MTSYEKSYHAANINVLLSRSYIMQHIEVTVFCWSERILNKTVTSWIVKNLARKHVQLPQFTRTALKMQCKCPNLTSLIPLFKGSDVPAKIPRYQGT